MSKMKNVESKGFVGAYLNPKITVLEEAMHTGIFVDKSKLLEHTNRALGTSEKCICIARPRRTGKTLAASMIANYYSCAWDNPNLFQDLAIASSPTYETHLHKYHVIYLDLLQASLDFADLLDKLPYLPEDRREQLPDYASMSLVAYLKYAMEKELREAFPGCADWLGSLGTILQEIHRNAPDHPSFVFVIDEWDYLFRKNAPAAEQEAYLDFLCSLFRGATRQAHLALVYMTGIYPIQRCRFTPLASLFNEYDMIEPLSMGQFMGFTEAEVQRLCLEHDMSFEDMKRWYDGYWFDSVGPVYNPYSVVRAIQERTFTNYWTETESYESLRSYIDQDKPGLKQTIALLMGGGTVQADTSPLGSESKPHPWDDVLTQLVHLGYLRCTTNPRGLSTLSIPNLEILEAFRGATISSDWAAVFDSLMDFNPPSGQIGKNTAEDAPVS